MKLCPPGSHPVQSHQRQTAKGLILVQSHCRKNPSSKGKVLFGSNLKYLYEATLHPLSGKPNRQGYIEIKRHPIELEYDELLDPIVNVAAGVRWLAHKIMTSPKRRSESQDERIFAGIKYYHSWDRAGEKYAERVLKLYRDSRKPQIPKGDL